MERGLLTGLVVFRWLAWAWVAVVLVVSRTQLDDPGNRPAVALALVAAALAFTAAATVVARS